MQRNASNLQKSLPTASPMASAARHVLHPCLRNISSKMVSVCVSMRYSNKETGKLMFVGGMQPSLQPTWPVYAVCNVLPCCAVIICPIAIAYSMGQIIKSVCVCQSVCPSASTLTVAFLHRFSPKLAQT